MPYVRINIEHRDYLKLAAWIEYKRRTTPHFPEDLSVKDLVGALLADDYHEHLIRINSELDSLGIKGMKDVDVGVRRLLGLQE